MTWNDLVREHFPDADDRFCEFVLWEQTTFPVVEDKDFIEKQIIEFKNKGNKI